MTTNEKVARRKLSLLELAKELNNVSKPASSSATAVSSSTRSAVTTRPMEPRGCSTNCPVVKGLIRTTWYESVEQIQTDLDSYLGHYNNQRPHQDRMMEGQTPYSMFKKGMKLIPKEVRSKVA